MCSALCSAVCCCLLRTLLPALLRALLGCLCCAAVHSAVRYALLGGLLGGATGTPLFSFPLPAIDLGSITPGSPPTTLIIQTTGAVRQNGTNVISGTVTTSEAP